MFTPSFIPESRCETSAFLYPWERLNIYDETCVHKLDTRLAALEDRICRACEAAQRPRSDVTLIGASKAMPSTRVREAAMLGVSNFGENYLDEALEKISTTKDLNLIWHYIGRIQSRKSKAIALNFDWVHTLDRAKVAHRLNDYCEQDKPLQVLIQVNINRDPAKAGVNPENAFTLLDTLLKLEYLQPRGLMTILATDADPTDSYQSVARLFDTLGDSLTGEEAVKWDTLSMGMTGDLEAAIACGATHIRIGTALFGARD